MEPLRRYFGHGSFRRGQQDVVRAVLEGCDVLAMMPTGSGKSLGFQLPAVLLPGTTIVVSPLIALMKDQVDELNRRGIAAAALGAVAPIGGILACLRASPAWRVVGDARGVGRPSASYTPKSPVRGVLYRVVREHFETFRLEAARAHERDGLPRCIEEDFRGFLRCGFRACGFARFHRLRCGADRLVPFSCKGSAVCSSCGGRRMAERATHLVDHVFPEVPIRQWVLSPPHRLRYTLVWDHALCPAVTGVFVRAVWDGIAAARGAAERPPAVAGRWRSSSGSDRR
jgi:hypothetical protein